jgi:AMMECR1 domain-containing protein
MCSVSFLVKFENAKDAFDWEIGTHGILIEFEHDNHYGRATYLPEVALEHNMTKEVAINGLIKKSGYYKKDFKEIYPKI